MNGDSVRRSPDPSLLALLSDLCAEDLELAVQLLTAAGAYSIKIVANEWEPLEFKSKVAGAHWATSLWHSCDRAANSSAQVARGGMEAFSICKDGRKRLGDYVVGCLMFFIFVLEQLPPRRIYLGNILGTPVISYSDAAWEPINGGDTFHATMGSLVLPQSPTLPTRLGRAKHIPSSWLASLVPRETQILPCELLGMLCTIWSDREAFRNRNAIFFIDNLAGACILVKGCSHEPDVQWITTAIHLLLFKLRCRWWIEWIPSECNPSDPLSRFEDQDFVASVEEMHIPFWAFPGHSLRDLFDYFAGAM